MSDHSKAQTGSAKFASVTLNPHNQNLESVHGVVASILKMAGCGQCGRLANLHIDFLSDPPADLAKNGVISISQGGLREG
jgi:hypothetical protein